MFARKGFSVIPLAGLIAAALSSCSPSSAPSAGQTTVQVMTVQQANVPVTSEWIGTLQGSVNANISAKVSGYLLQQLFVEGSLVKQGDVLFKLDPRQYQAVLDQAKGQLAEAQAKLAKAKMDVQRYTPLAAENAISQQELDDAVISNQGAQASLDAAQAAVEGAQINLDFCTMTSPIDGRVGLANAQIGDLISPTSGALTSVSTVDPMKVFFPVTEQQYLRYIAHEGQNSAATSGGQQPDIILRLTLADGSVYPLDGKITAANRQIDQNTGALTIVGEFPNPNSALRPGMYARIRAITRTLDNALIVPQTAVSEVQGSNQLTFVGPDKKVAIRTVEMGDKYGEWWVVKKGAQAGETVIVQGVQKVAPGMTVTTEPATVPPLPPEGNTTAPTPVAPVKAP